MPRELKNTKYRNHPFSFFYSLGLDKGRSNAATRRTIIPGGDLNL
jgi:hypothetical protein